MILKEMNKRLKDKIFKNLGDKEIYIQCGYDLVPLNCIGVSMGTDSIVLIPTEAIRKIKASNIYDMIFYSEDITSDVKNKLLKSLKVLENKL